MIVFALLKPYFTYKTHRGVLNFKLSRILTHSDKTETHHSSLNDTWHLTPDRDDTLAELRHAPTPRLLASGDAKAEHVPMLEHGIVKC